MKRGDYVSIKEGQGNFSGLQGKIVKTYRFSNAVRVKLIGTDSTWVFDIDDIEPLRKE